ncbi:hypothetical protein [Polaribacter atrinae]|uniref:Uncharacterized protein n=1 Tax=Polaribacter atrinae TaxID=1333662 RepID=A0A176T3C2_9FLAO|nr:hypothetical protein [Polaribacter atrinae]OAD42378.1 hypothetical protein LPB303_14870 [Polaribacter atrinae]
MEEFWADPYFNKIILTIIAVLTKLFFGFIFKTEKDYQGILILAYYILPIVIIVWLNLDPNIENSKLTTTIICINIGLIIFNYLQQNITDTNKMLGQLANTEYDKVEKVKQINAVQVEKMKAINENQKYILSEISKINDRIIGHFKDRAE